MLLYALVTLLFAVLAYAQSCDSGSGACDTTCDRGTYTGQNIGCEDVGYCASSLATLNGLNRTDLTNRLAVGPVRVQHLLRRAAILSAHRCARAEDLTQGDEPAAFDPPSIYGGQCGPRPVPSGNIRGRGQRARQRLRRDRIQVKLEQEQRRAQLDRLGLVEVFA